MLRVAQECFSGRLGCEHARLSFDAKLELEAADTGNEAHDGLRKVDVEIVAGNGPVCGGSGAAEQVAEKPREILFRPGIANDAFDLASGDVESGDLKNAPLSVARCSARGLVVWPRRQFRAGSIG